MKAASLVYERVGTVAQALAALAGSDGMVKPSSGGQSLTPMLNLRLAVVERLVDVSRIPALRGFEQRGETLRIGAAVTHASIEDGDLPDVTRGLLPKVAAGIAYRAVRNRGTLGGSLAHADPAADWVATMCLLDAGFVLQGPAGERVLRAADFFVGAFTTALAADELLVAVDVPCLSNTARWSYRKVCRKPGEFADAIAAVWVDSSQGISRAVIGALDGMPVVVDPRRPEQVQQALAGIADEDEREVHAAMLRRALKDIDAA